MYGAYFYHLRTLHDTYGPHHPPPVGEATNYKLERVKIMKQKLNNNMKKETWKLIIQMIVAVLTAIATTLGVTACLAS